MGKYGNERLRKWANEQISYEIQMLNYSYSQRATVKIVAPVFV